MLLVESTNNSYQEWTKMFQNVNTYLGKESAIYVKSLISKSNLLQGN